MEVKPCKEQYEVASAAVKMISLASRLPGPIGALAGGVKMGAKAAVFGAKTLHNALKNSMRIILTTTGIHYAGNYLPYTLIEDIAVIENEEVRVQEEDDKELVNGQLIRIRVSGDDEFWEISLHEYVGLSGLPLALFLAAAARLYGNYGSFGRELNDEEAMHLSRITLSVLDDECILDYL